VKRSYVLAFTMPKQASWGEKRILGASQDFDCYFLSL